MLEAVEEGKIELEKVMVCFKDPNKLTAVKNYLQRKESDPTHLTIEVRVIEQVMAKNKDGRHQFVFLIHLNAVNVQAYFYFIHNETNIVQEGEVYILENVN